MQMGQRALDSKCNKMSIETKAKSVLNQAQEIAKHVDSWADFSNALFGQNAGLIAETFRDPMERQTFYDTEEYQAIYDILDSLKDRFGISEGATPKKSGKFVVRMPHTLHEVLDIEAKNEGVSLNQLVVAKLAWPLREKVSLSTAKLARAYADVFDGYATDRVVVDPILDKRFLRRCRELGLVETDYHLNHALYDIRKSGKAELPACTKRTQFDDLDKFRFASEIAVRIIQRTEGVTLDRILCDPALAIKFDTEARRLTEESSSLKLRWAALNLRKTHRLQPVDLTAPKYELISVGPVRTVNLADVPALKGTYVFYDFKRPIYAGETDNVRDRIRMHIEKGLASWIDNRALELRFFTEKSASQADRLRWLRRFINEERPLLNYQIAA